MNDQDMMTRSALGLTMLITALQKQVSPRVFLGTVAASLAASAQRMEPMYWAKLLKSTEPCGQPGCDCHVLMEECLAFLKVGRDQAQKVKAQKHN